MLQGLDPESERHAKELLYRCMEELGAVKAALYLSGSGGSFELAAHYGFGRRDAVEAEVKAGSPLYDWVRRHRTMPSYLNNPKDDAALGPFLEHAGSARLLTIPLTVGDRLVGLVDARDKARKLAYSPEDVPIARAIGAGLESFLRELGMYGPAVAPAQGTTPRPAPALADSRLPLPFVGVLQALAAVATESARLPTVAATALTVTDGKTVRALVLRTSPLESRQREALAAHQIRGLEASGARVPPLARWGWTEEASDGSEKRAEEIRSAVILAGPPVWAVFSVLTPTGVTAGDTVLALARGQFELARQLRDYRKAARNLARILLEPGETTFPHLRQHSQAVSELAQRLAAGLGVREEEEELITVAAYLHDVGLRELDYARTYRMERPGELEKRLYQRHPVVGARILESAEFPGDLAGIVRHHHERWDGGGYPNRLAGKSIPLGSRIVHLAEVYDVLTSPSSYRRTLGRDAALDLIRSESGRQFDPELVPLFEDLVRA